MGVESSATAVARDHSRSAPWHASLICVVALVVIFTTAAAFESVKLRALSDGDIWGHLRVGTWVIDHHAIPRVGLFSQSDSREWVDSSWLYEVIVAATYRLAGLRAIPALLIVFKLALALLTFWIARGWNGNFWAAIMLSALAQYAIPALQPAPYVFSMLFFGAVTGLLLRARRTRNLHALAWLPLLFVFWANLDVQFVVGLAAIALFIAAEAIETGFSRAGQAVTGHRRFSLLAACFIGLASTVATLVTPYGQGGFADAVKTVYSPVLFENFGDMAPMPFRQPQHFIILLLLMAGFFALGRQRSRDIFKIVLLSLGTLLSLRVQRDAWIGVMCAIGILAEATCESPSDFGLASTGTLTRRAKVLAVGLSCALVIAALLRLPGDQVLTAQVEQQFPVKAAEFIRAGQLTGPLFNEYAWGGFLTWYLPEYPVIIDGRVNLYGDMNAEYFRITSGKQVLDTAPEFIRARTLLLQPKSGLAKALTTLPALTARYRVAYQDDVAVVLVAL